MPSVLQGRFAEEAFCTKQSCAKQIEYKADVTGGLKTSSTSLLGPEVDLPLKRTMRLMRQGS